MGGLKALKRALDNRSLKIAWERHKRMRWADRTAAVLGPKAEQEARTQRVTKAGRIGVRCVQG